MLQKRGICSIQARTSICMENVDKSMLIQNKYMWFPNILLLQAITFCIPNGFWLYFGRQSDCNYIIDLCYKSSLENDNRPAIKKIARQIEKYYKQKIINFQIICSYLITKEITMAICCINFLFLWDTMFQREHMYPFNIIRYVITNTEIQHNHIFQSLVFCKTLAGEVGAMNTYTSQCMLTGNTIYEKIFSLIYCLTILSALVTTIDLIKWIMFYIFKKWILSKYLKRRDAVQFSN